VTLSVVIITYNEEANIARTLESVKPLVSDGKGEIIIVDSGSTDRTAEIAEAYGAKVFVEEWKGYAAQKNSALDKVKGDWILSLDADEELEPELVAELLRSKESDTTPSEWCLTMAGTGIDESDRARLQKPSSKQPSGFCIPRKNFFLGKWIKHGGFWPDPKLRLFRKGAGIFESRLVHEDAKLVAGTAGNLKHALLHHSYPTLADYLDHMNRYSSLGAEMAVATGHRGFSVINIVIRPLATFVYNYFFRLGFLDGREGLLLHLYHAVYVSWKYAKAWELARKADSSSLRSSE
jgi:glycosyltransferase involved in cell wall biosynthesis